MKTEVREWNGEQPPTLVPLIGKKVIRAWESRRILVLELEDRKYLQVEAAPHVGDIAAVVSFTVGNAKAGHDWTGLDRAAPQTPYTEEIRGMAFTGIDADIVMFGTNRGAKVTLNGIEWVMNPAARS